MRHPTTTQYPILPFPFTPANGSNMSYYADYIYYQIRNASKNSSVCDYEKMPYLEIKFIIVAIIGMSISATGMFLNTVSVYVLTRPSIRQSHVLYLAVLSLLDIWLLLGYIMLFSIQILFDWTESLALYRVWLSYCQPMFCISKMMQIASTYLIVVATFERYCMADGHRATFLKGVVDAEASTWTTRRRLTLIFIVIGIAVLIKMSSCFELQIEHNAQCSGFSAYSVRFSWLAQNWYYQMIVMFYASHIIRVFIPFFLLLYLNIKIVRTLKRNVQQAQEALMMHLQNSIFAGTFIGKEKRTRAEQMRKNRKTLQAATRMLVAVVTSHLVTNVLSLTITLIEHMNIDFLKSHLIFYTMSVDVINLLAIINSSIRFPIYYFCNKLIRQEVRIVLRKLRGKQPIALDSPEPSTENAEIRKRPKRSRHRKRRGKSLSYIISGCRSSNLYQSAFRVHRKETADTSAQSCFNLSSTGNGATRNGVLMHRLSGGRNSICPSDFGSSTSGGLEYSASHEPSCLYDNHSDIFVPTKRQSVPGTNVRLFLTVDDAKHKSQAVDSGVSFFDKAGKVCTCDELDPSISQLKPMACTKSKRLVASFQNRNQDNNGNNCNNSNINNTYYFCNNFDQIPSTDHNALCINEYSSKDVRRRTSADVVGNAAELDVIRLSKSADGHFYFNSDYSDQIINPSSNGITDPISCNHDALQVQSLLAVNSSSSTISADLSEPTCCNVTEKTYVFIDGEATVNNDELRDDADSDSDSQSKEDSDGDTDAEVDTAGYVKLIDADE